MVTQHPEASPRRQCFVRKHLRRYVRQTTRHCLDAQVTTTSSQLNYRDQCYMARLDDLPREIPGGFRLNPDSGCNAGPCHYADVLKTSRLMPCVSSRHYFVTDVPDGVIHVGIVVHGYLACCTTRQKSGVELCYSVLLVHAAVPCFTLKTYAQERIRDSAQELYDKIVTDSCSWQVHLKPS